MLVTGVKSIVARLLFAASNKSNPTGTMLKMRTAGQNDRMTWNGWGELFIKVMSTQLI